MEMSLGDEGEKGDKLSTTEATVRWGGGRPDSGDGGSRGGLGGGAQAAVEVEIGRGAEEGEGSGGSGVGKRDRQGDWGYIFFFTICHLSQCHAPKCHLPKNYS